MKSDFAAGRGRMFVASRELSDRPYVAVNMAMSADGKIATANREVDPAVSADDRARMQELRAAADAVMAGAATLASRPWTLAVRSRRWRRWRVSRGWLEQPLRVVVTSRGVVDPAWDIFRERFFPIVVLTSARAGESRVAKLKRSADAVGIFGEDEIDFPAAMKWLRRVWAVRVLVCEGGGKVNDGLFRAGVVDELHLRICPQILGGEAAPTIADGRGWARLEESASLELKRSRRIQGELYVVYTVQQPAAPRRSAAL